jgi:hypothetical protein
VFLTGSIHDSGYGQAEKCGPQVYSDGEAVSVWKARIVDLIWAEGGSKFWLDNISEVVNKIWDVNVTFSITHALADIRE